MTEPATVAENRIPTSTDFRSFADVVAGFAVADQNDIAVDGIGGAAGGFTTTVAVAYFDVSATLVARTVTVCCVDTDNGAV